MYKEAEYFAPTWKIMFALEFWKLYIICFTQIFFGYFMIISYKSIGMWQINDDEFLTSAGACGLFFNGVFRSIWPNLLERFSFKCINICILILQINLILAIPYILSMKWAYFFAVTLSIMCEGGIASLLPTLALKVFGDRKGPTAYSLLYSSIGVSALTGSFVV